MRIVSVPCLQDNYAYLVICEVDAVAAVVDPSESEPVLAALSREGVTLKAVWNTHHHWDHTGGNKELLEAYPELEVVGHASDKGRIPGQTTFARDGDRVTLGQEVSASIIHNPGHTSGAISYYLEEHAAVLTGDTLFCAGCGRLFEGTPEQMHASLSRLAALPESTRVYCGHEYTAANLRFAGAVEPDNRAVKERAAQVEQIRALGRPSIPATMAEERATNPFLRVAEPGVMRAVHPDNRRDDPAADQSPVQVFAALRRWKDHF
jgi:hydroxyacylglutathione hydrolase